MAYFIPTSLLKSIAVKLSTTALRHYGLPSLQIAFAYVTEAYRLLLRLCNYGLLSTIMPFLCCKEAICNVRNYGLYSSLRRKGKSLVITLSHLGK